MTPRSEGVTAVLSGRVVADRYRLVERLGPARSASVWLGWDDLLGRPMAIKPVEHDAALGSPRERATREARLTGRLQHANVVAVYDVVEDQDRIWVVMPFIPSRSLARLLAEREILSPADVARIGTDISAALAGTHGLGVAHGAVDPESVLITEDGSARLIHFSCAREVGDGTLSAGAQAADVFALGTTLREALQSGYGGVAAPLPANGALHRLIDRMSDPEPARRPSAAAAYQEFSTLLTALESGSTTAHTGKLSLPNTELLTRVDPSRRPPAQDVAAPVGATPRGAAVAPVPAVSARAAELPFRGERPEPERSEPAPAGPPPLRPTAGDPRTRRRRRRPSGAAMAAVLVGVLLVASVAVLLFVQSRTSGRGGAVAGHRPSASAMGNSATSASASSRASTGQSPTARTTRSHSAHRHAAPAASTPALTSTASSSSVVAAPPAVTGGQPSDSQLAAAISHYYSLMPGDLTDGWRLMTRSYRETHAGGWSAYQQFWSSISSVEATNVVGWDGSNAEATLIYHFNDGRVTTEDTVFTLVPRGSTLKIAESRVASSTSG